jgi:histidinol-phosphate aminotransferase
MVVREKVDIEKLVRENIRNLVPYSSARDDFSGSASIFLDANENPFNAPLNRYPDPRQSLLKNLVANLKDQSPGNLFLGNGSDEGIDLLYRVLCVPGMDNVITVDPTYGMYRVCAEINGVPVRSVLLDEDFGLDPGKILGEVDHHTKMIFICSPNNPTSNAFDRGKILEVVDAVPCMVVVDEAYADFSKKEGLLSLVPEKKNLVVLQTFSKAWGLAGIRLGMVFAHPDLIKYLSSVKYPYNVNTLTMNEALERLEGDPAPHQWVEQILAERERLQETLGQYKTVLNVFPSDANFLLVKVDDPGELYRFLMDHGIIVRDRSTVPLCEGCLRITVGTSLENDRLLEVMNQYERGD